jgi:phage gp29-like protein
MAALQDLVQDTVGIVPDDSSVEFIAGSQSATSEVYKKFIDFCNNEISKALLAQTLTTDVPEHGTYAAARAHQGVLRHLLLGDKRLVEKAFNSFIAMILRLNYRAGEDAPPQFELYSEDDINKPLAERDRLIRRQGVRFTKEYYKRAYNLSDEDFTITER